MSMGPSSSEILPLIQPIKKAKEVSNIELGGALVLLVFGMVPMVMGWVFLRGHSPDLRDWIATEIVGVFVFAVIETFAIILLWGFKRLDFSEGFARWLGGATVGEVITVAAWIVEQIFSKHT